ncbi:MAG: hypothetical protein M1479_00250 [Actinobacteria bacterium]|nr:hypothetical protein [Actinomycetota bacterium]
MKRLYLLVALVFFTLILSFSFACNESSSTGSKTTYSETITTAAKPLTVDVKYIVFGDTGNDVVNPEVSVTYTNYQGGTEQISNLVLKGNPNDIMVYKLEDVRTIKAALVAEYKKFPIDNFMYISAQNQKDYGVIWVFIVINDTLQKMSKAKGAYAIAEANYYYYSE